MKKALLRYLAALLLFGSNGVVAGHISMASGQIVLLRTFAGSGMLLLALLLSRAPRAARAHPKELLAVGLSGAAMGASWMLLYAAYVRIGVGAASLLYYCGPVLVVAVSAIWLHERIGVGKAVCFLCVLAGVVCVNGGASGAGGDAMGIVFALGSAGLYAVMVLANRRARHIGGLENAALQLTGAFLTVAACMCIRGGLDFHAGLSDWLWLLVLGFVNTGAGCLLYFSSIGQLSVQTVAICGYLEPLSAVVFSALLLRERLRPVQGLGAVLVLGGAVLCEAGPVLKQRASRRRAD